MRPQVQAHLFCRHPEAAQQPLLLIEPSAPRTAHPVILRLRSSRRISSNSADATLQLPWSRLDVRASQPAAYIMTNQRRTVLYVGVTADLRKRMAEHKAGVHLSSFTRRYNVECLVYFETTPSITAAIAREKQLKGWKRSRKIELIESTNPEWRDLAADVLPL